MGDKLITQEKEKNEEELQQEQLQKQLNAWARQMSNVQFWKFINSNNFIVAVEKVIQNMASNRKTFLYTYLFDIILVLVLLGSVVVLGYSKILDGVTVGTLVGAIIGYALGRFRQD